MKIKKISALFLIGVILLSVVLAGCSKEKDAPAIPSSERLTAALEGTETGKMEDVTKATYPDFPFKDVLPLDMEKVEDMSMRVSMMNIRAEAYVLVKPIAGDEKAYAEIKAALNAYLVNLQKNFEFYLPDQYDIAMNGALVDLEDGTIALIIGENSDAIVEKLQAK